MFWKFTGQPEPVCKHHNCDLFTLWLVYPSLWLVNIASCPFAVHLQPFCVCIFYKPWKIAKEGNLKPSLLQSEQTKLSQPLLAHHLHQPLVPEVCSQTWPSELVFLLPVLQLKPEKTYVKEKHHFSWPAGYTLSNSAQSVVVLPCCKGALAAHVQPVSHHHPQLLLCQAASWPVSSQPVLLHRVVQSQVKDCLCLCWTSGGLLQPVSPACWGLSACSSPLCFVNHLPLVCCYPQSRILSHHQGHR